MQGRQPLAIGHVGLAPGQIAYMAAVDHHHFQPRGFQHAVGIQPIDPSGLHRQGTNTLGFEIITQPIDFHGNGPKDHRRISGNGQVELFAAHIDGSSMSIDHR